MPTLDDLEKLNELKEKGIISPEEFEQQKTQILNNTSQPTLVPTSHTDNSVKTVLITIGTILGGCLMSFLFGPAGTFFLVVASALILAIMSSKYKVSRYDAWYCGSTFGIFFLAVVFWIVGFPIGVYAILQVRSGAVALKVLKC